MEILQVNLRNQESRKKKEARDLTIPHPYKSAAVARPFSSPEQKKQSPILLLSFVQAKSEKVPTFAFRYISPAEDWAGEDSCCKSPSNSSLWSERGLKLRKSPYNSSFKLQNCQWKHSGECQENCSLSLYSVPGQGKMEQMTVYLGKSGVGEVEGPKPPRSSRVQLAFPCYLIDN